MSNYYKVEINGKVIDNVGDLTEDPTAHAIYYSVKDAIKAAKKFAKNNNCEIDSIHIFKIGR